ncbi:hypothetical protein NK638_09655 [Psychrobacter sp. A3]|uniref:hypothetical protein n=1 Tax=Psychrobacter sp. A3 TaxID=2992754 RepID=UPI00237B820D|nr:hypothetical protein [Psychrobacter sp. A3]MDE0491784.1 hypothetical protein [Psychrobacter sp. A3]
MSNHSDLPSHNADNTDNMTENTPMPADQNQVAMSTDEINQSEDVSLENDARHH